jgi:hypothetical protein
VLPLSCTWRTIFKEGQDMERTGAALLPEPTP